MDFGIIFQPENLALYWDGLVNSMVLLAASLVVGGVLAVPLAVARVSGNRFIRGPVWAFTYVMRGTPLLAQTYLIYYGLGELLPGTWIQQSFLWPYLREGFWYAIFAFSLNTAGYTGEILRGAMAAVPKGEIEAAKAYGMSSRLIFWRVLLPRAIQICLPTMTVALAVEGLTSIPFAMEGMSW